MKENALCMYYPLYVCTRHVFVMPKVQFRSHLPMFLHHTLTLLSVLFGADRVQDGGDRRRKWQRRRLGSWEEGGRRRGAALLRAR